MSWPGLAAAQACPPDYYCEPNHALASAGPAASMPADEPQSTGARPHYRPRRLALNLRFSGVPADGRFEPSLGGAGLGFRYRPVLWFAVEPGLDFFGGGTDATLEHRETMLDLSALFYFNPRDAAQIYAALGVFFGGGSAELRAAPTPATSQTQHYDFSSVGGVLGLGAEFRITHLVSLNVDVLGFQRHEAARSAPVATGSEELASSVPASASPRSPDQAGVLLRGGISFYF